MTTPITTPTTLISGIGFGFNTFTGAQMPSALSSTSTTTSQGLSSQFYVKVCSSVDSFNKATSHSLGVTAQINASSGEDGAEGDDSGSSDDGPTFGETASLSNALNLSDTSISVVVYSNVVTNSLIYDSSSLASNITVPVTAAESLALYQQYGDTFVSAVTEGGEYMAIFVYYCQTEQDQKAVQESLSANDVVNVDGTNANLGATVSGGLSNTVTNTNVRCSIYQSLLGSTATLPADTGTPQAFAEAIINFAQNFTASQVNQPVVFDFATQGYETLFDTVNPGFQAIAANRAIYTESVGPNLANLQSLWSKYQWINNAYQTYGYTGDTQLATNQKQLVSDINGLNQWLLWQTPAWTPSSLIPNNNVGSAGGMGLAAFNGQLYMAYVGSNNLIYVFSSSNGLVWDNQVQTGLYCIGAPALAVYNGQLCLAFTSNGGGNLTKNGLYASASSNGSSFSTPVMFGRNSSNAGPSLAVAGGLLYMAFTGTNSQLNLSSSSNGTAFANQTVLPSAYLSTSSSVNTSVAVSGNSLYVAFSATSNGTACLGVGSATIGSSGLGTFGTPSYVMGGAVGGILSLSTFNGSLYAAWSNGGNVVLWNQALGTAASSCSSVATGGQPALVAYDNQLGLAYTSATTSSANVNFMALAGGVAGNPTQSASLPQTLNPPQSLLNGVPGFNYATPTQTQTAWGGTGGNPYQDIDVGSSANTASSSSSSSTSASGSASASVQSKSSPTVSGGTTVASSVNTTGLPIPISSLPVISSITLWGLSYMGQIDITYDSPTGNSLYSHGTWDMSGDSSTINLKSGEFITSIGGSWGEYVNQLKFVTNLGNSLTYPPNPESASGVISWSSTANQANQILVGFQGHCGSYLNQLQPIVIDIQPAKWVAPSLTPQPYTEVLPVSEVGVGFNTFTGSALPNSALNATASVTSSQGLQSASYVKICASVESLEQTLSQTSGFSIGVPGLFKVGHTKTKTQSLNVKDTSVSVVVVTQVVTESPAYTACALSSAAQALEPSAFFTQYGDSYVSSTVNGGEYVAVFVYDCQSMTESQSVEKSLTAGIDADGANVDADLASTLSNTQSSVNVTCTCHQSVRGSSDALPELTFNPTTDITSLVNYAAGFDAASVNAPVVLSFTTSGYESLYPADASFQNILTNRTTYKTQVAPVLSSLYGIWSQILSLAKTYQTYGYTGDANISFPAQSGSKSGEVASAINGLNSWIDAVALNPFTVLPLVSSLNPPAALANGSPTLVYTTPTNPIWGSVITTPYQDVEIGMAIAVTNTGFNTTSSNPNPIPLTNLPVIGSISLWGSSWVNEIAVTYDLPTGPSTFTHGQTGGSADYAYNLQTGEFITKISGTSGDYINQLTFTSNLGQTYTFPPTAISAPNSDSWSASAGEVLVGFQGSSGSYLNQLQPITIQFQPAEWNTPLLATAIAEPALPVTGLGVGFNTFINSAMPNSAAVAPSSIGSQNVASQNFVQVCNSSGSLDKTVKHSFGLSVKGQSAKHKTSSSVNSSNTSVSVVVYANAVKSSPIYSTDPILLPAAAELTPAELFTAYGDSYVSAATLGAEYMAVFVYECETESDQQSVMNSFAAQGVVPTDPPVSIGVNFSKSMTNANSQTTVNCRAYQMLRGSSATLPEITNDISTDINNLVSFAQNLSVSDVTGNGVILEFATTGYETLMSSTVATAFQPIATNRQAYTNSVAPSLASLNTLRNAMQQVASLYKTYGYTGDGTFISNCQQLNQDTAALESWINQVNLNPAGIYTPLNPPKSVSNGSPSAQFQVETGSAWGGGTSATAWYDLATSSASTTNPTNAKNNSSNPATPIALSAQPVLASVTLWGEAWMNEIGTSYQTNSGTVQFVHGGGGVNPQPPLNLRVGEFITSISGTSGDYINQLTLNTNFGQSVTFPPSPHSASAFSWTVPAGATLVGFQGTCGAYLNQLQPVYIQFQPAIWVQYASVAQYIPAGSYQGSSSEITIQIKAQCTPISGSPAASSLTYTTAQAVSIGDIGNINGVLTIATGNSAIKNSTNQFGQYVPAGSYQGSSSGITVTISANCLNVQGNSVASSLTYTTAQAANIQDISNNNGVLTIINT
ncbi:MAG: jacalin-like lectin [Candidatus Methylumidiphilus sp.]